MARTPAKLWFIFSVSQGQQLTKDHVNQLFGREFLEKYIIHILLVGFLGAYMYSTYAFCINKITFQKQELFRKVTLFSCVTALDSFYYISLRKVGTMTPMELKG